MTTQELQDNHNQDISELIGALKEAKVVMYNLSHKMETRPLHEIFGEIDKLINKHCS